MRSTSRASRTRKGNQPTVWPYSRTTAARRSSASRPRCRSAPGLSCWPTSSHTSQPEAVEHGPEWKAAEEAIFQKYNEILDAKIPDEPVEVTVTPHEVGDGGILAMPLKANIPDPQRDDWKLVTCPICGAECWENDLARQAMAAEPELRAACTTCALKAGVAAGGKH